MTLVDLSHEGWFLDEREVLKGNRVKYTATSLREGISPIEGVSRWMWKTSKPTYPLEFWSEVLAAAMAAEIGLPVPRAFPAIYDGEYGALMEFMIDPDAGQTLDHGGDLLLAIKPDYDRGKGKDHSVQLILRALQSNELRRAIYPKLFQQWLFDGVIGNQDRHQDNWGFIVRPEPGGDIRWIERVAPAFDNGSSLGRELQESKIARLLSDADALERYVDRGKAHVRWEEDGTIFELSHEDLLRRHIHAYPKSKETALNFLSFDADKVVEAIRRICAMSRSATSRPLSPEREEFLVRVTSRRIERLRSILE